MELMELTLESALAQADADAERINSQLVVEVLVSEEEMTEWSE